MEGGRRRRRSFFRGEDGSECCVDLVRLGGPLLFVTFAQAVHAIIHNDLVKESRKSCLSAGFWWDDMAEDGKEGSGRNNWYSHGNRVRQGRWPSTTRLSASNLDVPGVHTVSCISWSSSCLQQQANNQESRTTYATRQDSQGLNPLDLVKGRLWEPANAS